MIESDSTYILWEDVCYHGNGGIATFVVTLFGIYLVYAIYLRTNRDYLYVADHAQPLIRKSLVINEDRTRGLIEIYDPRLVALLRVSAYFGMYFSPKTKAPTVCKVTIGLMLVMTPVVKIVYPCCSDTYNTIIEKYSVSSLFESTSLLITPLLYLWYHCFFSWFYNRFWYCRKRDSDLPVAPYFWDNEISREIFMNDDFRKEGREAVLDSSNKWTVLTVWAIYLNVVIVLFSIGYEVWLGWKAKLSPMDCFWLGFLSVSTNGLEAVNVNTLLILALHTRMYRKISKVYFRVTKSGLKVKGIISAFTIYREMVDQAFYKLSRLSHTVSLMALGLLLLLIVVVMFSLISPFRQIHNTMIYTFLLGILVTAIWGYFVGHSIGGVFESLILPFLHLRKHFLNTHQGDCIEHDKAFCNWLYIDDMLQVAEMCGFERTQVGYIRQACEFFDAHKGELKTSISRIRATTQKSNLKDIFQNANSSSIGEIVKKAKAGKRFFKGGSISSVASSTSESPRHSGSSAVQYLQECLLQALSQDELSEQVTAHMQKLLKKMNTTVERFYPKALRTLLSEIPDELKDMHNLEEAVKIWASIRQSKEFQELFMNELLGQEEVVKKHIIAAVMKKIPNGEFLKLLTISPEAEDKSTTLLNLLISVVEQNAPELQAQIGAIVQRTLAKTATRLYKKN